MRRRASIAMVMKEMAVTAAMTRRTQKLNVEMTMWRGQRMIKIPAVTIPMIWKASMAPRTACNAPPPPENLFGMSMAEKSSLVVPTTVVELLGSDDSVLMLPSKLSV